MIKKLNAIKIYEIVESGSTGCRVKDAYRISYMYEMASTFEIEILKIASPKLSHHMFHMIHSTCFPRNYSRVFHNYSTSSSDFKVFHTNSTHAENLEFMCA